MNWTYQYDENSPKISVTMPIDATVDEVLVAFKQFLLGCGYYIEGDLTIEENKETHE